MLATTEYKSKMAVDVSVFLEFILLNPYLIFKSVYQ